MTSGKTVNTNKTLVANMEHVRWNAIPPIKGPCPQGLNNKPKQVKRRTARNKANRMMGSVPGKDVAHKDNNPMNNSPSNLTHQSKTKNRAEPRKRKGDPSKRAYARMMARKMK